LIVEVLASLTMKSKLIFMNIYFYIIFIYWSKKRNIR